MSIYKAAKVYRFDFMYNGVRHTRSGYINKQAARSAQEILRKRLMMEHPKDNRMMKREMALLDDLSATSLDKYGVLKEKYSRFLENPYNSLPDLVDMFFSDFELDYSYTDLKKIANSRAKKIKIPAKMRTIILKRDAYKCVLCGASPPDVVLHVDHIVPFSRGGVTEPRNLRVLCDRCNHGKYNLPFGVTG
jgi:hypothetical protein